MINMYQLLGLLIIGYLIIKSVCYSQNSASLTSIPHSEIPLTTTSITLSKNKISFITAEEFHQYTKLESLNLMYNVIEVFPGSSVAHCPLRTLILDGNLLKVFPDLSYISSTLTYLGIGANFFTNISNNRLDSLTKINFLRIGSNPFLQWPNLTLVGTESTSELTLFLSSIKLQDSEPTTYCHFTIVYKNRLSFIPKLYCNESSRIETLYLNKGSYGQITDLSSLSSLAKVESFKVLLMAQCGFSRFPNLPVALRNKLEKLYLEKNQISVIDIDRLKGFKLALLDLSSNKLKAIPGNLLLTATSVSLSNQAPKIMHMNQYDWNRALCKETNTLQTLTLTSSLTSLHYFPDLTHSLCHRGTALNIDMKKVSVPCDCSIMWLKKAMEQCHLTVLLDHLPCSLDNWIDVETTLNCPKDDYIMLFLQPDFGDYIIQSSTNRVVEPPNVFLDAVIVRGFASWLLKNDNSTASTTSSTTWTVGPGTTMHGYLYFPTESISYAAPIHNLKYNVSVYGELNSICSSKTTSVLPLTDGIPYTCVMIENSALYIHVSTHFTSFVYIDITVRNLSCEPFYLTVYVLTGPCNRYNQFNRYTNCMLMKQSQYSVSETEYEMQGLHKCLFTCDCTVLDCLAPGGVFIRASHIYGGDICEMSIGDRS